MADRYERIRDALAKEPTPGPWGARELPRDMQRDGYKFSISRGGLGWWIAKVTHEANGGSGAANAAYIAACDPDTIRELLAERDGLAAALEAARADAERYRYAVVCLGTDFDGDNFVSYRIDFNLPEPAHMKFEDDEWGTADVDVALEAARADAARVVRGNPGGRGASMSVSDERLAEITAHYGPLCRKRGPNSRNKPSVRRDTYEALIELAELRGQTRWIPVTERLPELTEDQRKPNSFGVPVLIAPWHGGENTSPTPFAYFGTRINDKPCFYIYGRQVFPTHWREIGPLPTAVERDFKEGA